MGVTVRPGDVRYVNGVPALVMKAEDDGKFRCCPVKPIREDGDDDKVTGKVVFVELSRKETGIDFYDAITTDWPLSGMGMCLPEFSAAICKDHVGKLLWRVFPQQVEKANFGFASIFRDVPSGTFDLEHPNSKEDWELYRRMSGPSMERFFALEADTCVEEDDGRMRPETKRERRNRLARRRRALKKAGVL